MAERKSPRRLGSAHRKLFNKQKTQKLWLQMRTSGLTMKRWCWVNRVLMGVLIKSMIKHLPDVWLEDKGKVGEFFEANCRSCTLPFYPNTKRNVYCSDPCANMFYPSKLAKKKFKKEDHVPSGDGTEDPSR